MRFICGGLAAVAAGGALLVSNDARAQLGTANVPLPNVMLMLDTSGSFEKMIDGTDPEAVPTPAGCGAIGNACQPGCASNPNRWGTAVQSLTGTVQPFYSCAAMDRSQIPFNATYGMMFGGTQYNPYDTNYYLPFHRPIASYPTNVVGQRYCAYGPGALPGASGTNGVGLGVGANADTVCGPGPYNADDFPSCAINQYYIDPMLPAVAPPLPLGVSCNFSQINDGAIDSATSLMRFGLMTFDNDTSPGTGVTTGANVFVSNVDWPLGTTTSPFDGQWSYFDNWNPPPGGAGFTKGALPGCSLIPPFELGARNPAAPPWEGRLIGFPISTADTLAVQANNDSVQLAVNAMRPYGATPIAGMFEDAEYYFWQDPSGPVSDPYVSSSGVTSGCRSEYVILLTDGAPNQDLRPACGAGAPPCPYELPDTVAGSMYNGNDLVRGRSGPRVFTYVIGFAVSALPAPDFTCSGFAASASFATTCALNPVPAAYQACCTLEKIAKAGSGLTTGAYFADTPGDLNKAFGAIIGNIAKQLSARTVPSYAPNISYNLLGAGQAAVYLAQFNAATNPWTGGLQRQRTVCTTSPPYTAVPQGFAAGNPNGDDFADNLNFDPTGTPPKRLFLTVEPSTTPVLNPTGSIRPYANSTPQDGLGAYMGTEIEAIATNIASGLSPAMLGIGARSCQDPLTRAYYSAADCTSAILAFTMAQAKPAAISTAFWNDRRAEAFGPILHSTPAVVGPPSSLVRDDTYQSFAAAFNVPNPNARPTTLYVATIDGLLHAFDTSVSTRQMNELWAFLPPGVLPSLLATYPSANQTVLDGAPVVKDVVWTRTMNVADWHTMLVAGFGAAGRGYYALDVTDPRSSNGIGASSNPWTAPSPPTAPIPAGGTPTGPHFMWQLTSMNPPTATTPVEIFGKKGVTPAIATVFTQFKSDTDGMPHEHGIAILPGGIDGPPQKGNCNRASSPGFATGDISPTTYKARTKVRNWTPKGNCGTDQLPGRSVTIVDIKTGEIIAVFARAQDMPPYLGGTIKVVTPLDSPMVGVPVVYPNDVGSVAQRFFIGDADGTLWRFDLTSADPTLWTGKLFMDAYNQTSDAPLVGGNDPIQDGQPIVIPPVVTLDRFANVTVQFATGDQDSYSTLYSIPGKKVKKKSDEFPVVNFVYSIKEDTTGATVASQMNWYLPLTQGEHVSGPMTVFEDVFYYTTYLPPSPGAASCNGGQPQIYARDFLKPNPTCSGGNPLACGGDLRDCGSGYPAPSFCVPAGLTGSILPGVSVQLTPSCGGFSSGVDPYSGGTHSGVTGANPGTFSLVSMPGGTNATGRINTFNQTLPTPTGSTIIDSWAALVE